MLKRLDRLWIGQLLMGFLMVLAALLVIDFLGKVFDEVGDVGDREYSLVAMLVYCVSIIPSRIHTFFPMAFLVGALVGLGRLALSSELIVMQVSGYSKFRIAIIGVVTAIATGIAVITLSEFVGQPLKKFAEGYRMTKRGVASSDVGLGFWAQDNNVIIRVNGVSRNGRLAGVRQYLQPQSDVDNATGDFGSRIVNAREAEFVEGGWRLHDVTTRTFTDTGIEETFDAVTFWATRLAPSIAKIIASNPEDLSLQDLYAFSRYQQANGIEVQRHDVLLLSRLLLPLTGAVMLILALPFSFGHARSHSLGRRIAVGIVLGLVYFVVAGSISNVVILTGMPSLVGALTPIVIFSFFGVGALTLSR